MAKESSLDPEFAEKFLNFIISEVIRHHVRIANEQADQDEETGLKAKTSSSPLEDLSPPQSSRIILQYR